MPETGRKHRIRAHAQWLGLPLVGDKIYGPDERCFLEAPLPPDLREFCSSRGLEIPEGF